MSGENEIQEENLSFEEAIERLEKTVQKLEQGELSLEESLSSFQEGIKLSRHCREILAKAEYRVEYLLKEEGLVKEEQGSEPKPADEENSGD